MRKIFLCFILCLSTATAFAQRILTGTVTDEQGEPLIGAAVRVKGHATLGTATDTNGQFQLSLPADGDYTLQTSYIGYETSEQTIGQDAQVHFVLREDISGLDQVVVTGTRTPKLLKDAPIITRVISEEDIQKIDATHIGDLLEQELPGLEFSYAMNQQVTLNMQGFGGTTVLFLVDGEKLAGETMDNVDYDRLNLDNVGRIEIVKGAASSLYGSNAMGGVVNLISKESQEPWTLNLNSRLGENDEQRYGGTFSFNAGKVFNSLNVQHTTIDDRPLPRDGEYSLIYGSKTWNFKDRLVYSPLDNLKLTARAGYFFRQRNYSVDEKNRYRDFSAGLKANWTIDDRNDLEVAYQFDQYDKSDYYPTTTGYDLKDYSNVQHTGRMLYNHTFAEGMLLTAGADVLRDYLMSYQFEDNGEHEQYTADAFAQFDWNITPRLNVIAGARFDYYSEADVRHLSPKLSAMYKLGRFTLRGSYAGGFRAPTLKELYMNYDMASIFMLYGNKDLKSETNQNVQVSAEYTWKGFNANISGYYNWVDNRITSVWDQDLYGMLYDNIDRMRIYGIEANVSLRTRFGLSGRIGYVYTHEHLKQGQMYQSYTSSARPHTATLRIEYDKDLTNNYGINIALSGRLLSSVDTYEYVAYVQDETGTVPTEDVHYPGYAIWKLSFTQRLWKGVRLIIAVDNLFDYIPDYYYNNSPTTLGTTGSVSLSLDIDKIIKSR